MTVQRSLEEIDPARDADRLRRLAETKGQGHVFRFWDELSDPERLRLLRQLAGFDFELLDRLRRELLHSKASAGAAALAPALIIRIPETPEERAAEARARERGEDHLRAGKVAAFTVAGGQGTRLGYDGPKGTFPIGPVSQRSLFALYGETIDALGRRYGKSIPWYIMTSETNHETTQEHFRAHDFFGLQTDDVQFFQQGMLPAMDPNGLLYLAEKSRVFTSPNGHGGSLKALHGSGALEDMLRRGIDTIFYFQVDNALVSICDPVFIGHHLLAGAEMSSKVIRKRDWAEKLGVIGLSDGRLTVIEYSDLPEAAARETLPAGGLRYWAGNLAIHLLAVDFIERLNEGGFQLPYHRAEKKVPHIDDAGRPVSPETKNGIKFETFVFDALGEARASVTMEVGREVEFSPVKNAEGDDSPATARRALTRRYLEWLEAAGAAIERDARGEFAGHVEIRPRTALDAGDLAGKMPTGTPVRDGFIM